MKAIILIVFLIPYCLTAQTYSHLKLSSSGTDIEVGPILNDQLYANECAAMEYPILFSVNKSTSKVEWAKKYQAPGIETAENYSYFKMSPNNKIVLGFMPSTWPIPVPSTTTSIISSLDIQGVPQWSKKLIFSVQYVLEGIGFDIHGNILLSGWGQETWAGNGKTWVTNMDTLGNVNWVKSYAIGSSGQIAYKIDGFSSGIYTSLVYTIPIGTSGKPVTVINRLDENGNVIWSKYLKDTQGKFYDYFRCVGEDSKGNIIIVGQRGVNSPLYGAFGIVVKMNPDGEVLFSKMVREDSVLEVELYAIGAVDQTNVVLGGTYQKDKNNNNAFAIKLDENGNKLNEQIYPHPMNKLGPAPWFNYLYQNTLYKIAKTSPKGYTLTGIAYSTPSDKTEAFIIETDDNLAAPCNSELPPNPFIVEDYPLTTVDVTLTVKDEVHNWEDAVILAKPYVLNDTIICQETVGTEEEPALENGSFIIAPNPTSEAITITNLGGSLKSPILQIVSPLAQILKTIALPENQTTHTVSVTDLPTGLYFLQILENGRTVRSLKFVKE